MKKPRTTTRPIRNLVLLVLVTLAGILLTAPTIPKILPHPDEHQFYFNAFRIMAGEELHNYLHVALTEYLLAAFLSIVNLIFDSGVNFPQGDPTWATFYYGRIFGFILYLVTFILGIIIVQKAHKKIRPRTIIFSILYFGSIGLYERFLRVNSDSMLIFVYANYIILSLWLHKNKGSVLRFFLLNTSFLFLGSFTNLKSLYMMAPIFFINTISPFIWYEKKDQHNLSSVYKFLIYIIGIALTCVVFWAQFIPKPFNHRNFWYGIKKTIVHGTKFDFDYPQLAYNSWAVYIYDFFIEYIGLSMLLIIITLFIWAYRNVGNQIIKNIFSKITNQLHIKKLRNGDLYQMTEVLLLASFITYYIGVSLHVIHWSRWGAPLGFLGIIILSPIIEHLCKFTYIQRKKVTLKTPLLIFMLFLFAWSLRIVMTIDIMRSAFLVNQFNALTSKSTKKFLEEKGITPEDGFKKVAWFSGYAVNVSNISLESLLTEKYSKVEYILWPYWNTPLLYTSKNIDLGTHNQRAFIDKYAESVTYRFPSIMSYYTHYTKYFAWRYLRITWIPELENMIEAQYGVVKLKEPIKDFKLSYDVTFNDMSHYYFPFSQIFNMNTLNDTYYIPPCYTYPGILNEKDGKPAVGKPSPYPMGPSGRSAGLYCHSTRFRLLFPGTYRIRIEGLPEDPEGIQKVFSNHAGVEWDPKTKTLTFSTDTRLIPGDFGVATKEKKIKNLKFRIFYTGKKGEL